MSNLFPFFSLILINKEIFFLNYFAKKKGRQSKTKQLFRNMNFYIKSLKKSLANGRS